MTDESDSDGQRLKVAPGRFRTFESIADDCDRLGDYAEHCPESYRSSQRASEHTRIFRQAAAALRQPPPWLSPEEREAIESLLDPGYYGLGEYRSEAHDTVRAMLARCSGIQST